MALKPLDKIHALQIQAGMLGRKAGHQFEDTITEKINAFVYPLEVYDTGDGHVQRGEPASLLLNYLGAHEDVKTITAATAISTGALATSEEGKKWLSINGASISRCKSDLVITLTPENGKNITVGISTKQCNNRTCTNAQLYFTTAIGFSNLLQSRSIMISENAVRALRQFCGDQGFRPLDSPSLVAGRVTDPRRFFWEEIDPAGRIEWEGVLSRYQDEISRLLFQKAYINDPFTPDYLLHKTKRADDWDATEVAIYSIDELIELSRAYKGFTTRAYSIRKGRYKDPQGITHLAPRIGVIQIQRGGQQQHPAQLQFNLAACYFYKI